jgi:hypothetical protein
MKLSATFILFASTLVAAQAGSSLRRELVGASSTPKTMSSMSPVGMDDHNETMAELDDGEADDKAELEAVDGSATTEEVEDEHVDDKAELEEDGSEDGEVDDKAELEEDGSEDGEVDDKVELEGVSGNETMAVNGTDTSGLALLKGYDPSVAAVYDNGSSLNSLVFSSAVVGAAAFVLFL